ncbi:aspartyl protease family protein [Paraglaciecola aestuariivivens]
MQHHLIKVLTPLVVLLISFSTHSAVSEWTDIVLENGHIKIPVIVAGHDTFAILDTGAQINGINSAFIQKHKMKLTGGHKIKVKGLYGQEIKSVFNSIPMALFGFDTELNEAVSVSLGHHSTGILMGASFFSKFIVQLDYPKQRMRIITRDTLNLREIENIQVKKQRGTGEPLVKVSLGKDSTPFWALLDTGNNGGVLIERGLAKKHGLLDKITSSSLSAGVNKISTIENVRVDEFVFGPYTLENVLVNIPAVGQSSNIEDQNTFTGTRIKSVKQRGVIGYDILKHFVLTLDYHAGNAHIAAP